MGLLSAASGTGLAYPQCGCHLFAEDFLRAGVAIWSVRDRFNTPPLKQARLFYHRAPGPYKGLLRVSLCIWHCR